nr:MAG TPA: hypothetical protein [Caudoviricetes sp.]
MIYSSVKTIYTSFFLKTSKIYGKFYKTFR